MKSFIVILALLIGTASTNIFAGDDKPAYGGFCPVSYTMMHKNLQGQEKYASSVNGVTYYLANAKAKKMFDENPSMFIDKMAYDGWCTTGMSMGKKIEADPSLYTEVDGTTYRFSSKEAQEMFDKSPANMIEAADDQWIKISQEKE